MAKKKQNLKRELKLSKYPKTGLTFSQIDDEKKLVEYEKAHGIKQICHNCGHNKFMITTMGLRVCSECYTPTGFIL